uniref:Uncharacterized protein n=1 Tax=Oryza punctata TaxID=4537 RepID=A0A0E0KZN4_ORYPU
MKLAVTAAIHRLLVFRVMATDADAGVPSGKTGCTTDADAEVRQGACDEGCLLQFATTVVAS